MSKLRILGLVALVLAMLATDAMAQRRGGGGAVSGGVRGAVVGGMVGGSSGAQTGAKVGAVAGATGAAVQRSQDRRGVDSETQSRTQYESSAEYQNEQHSDYNAAPPEVLISAPSDQTATAGGEAIIRKDGKPIVGITYPSDWKQKAGDNSASAISAKGNAWSAIATLDGVKDKEAGIAKIRQGLEKYLQNIDYDDPTKTEGGALVITGTGKGKKGVDVVFAAGVFDAAPGQLAGVAFVVDKNVEDRYKEAARYICKTIRVEKDFTEQKHEVAKPIISNK
jgi:uncharacterized protein YcfJ